MLTRLLAKALAPEVRVCGVAPGPVAVEPGQEERRAAETLLGRIGSPDDIAEAVVLPRRSRLRRPERPSSSTAAGFCNPAGGLFRRSFRGDGALTP